MEIWWSRLSGISIITHRFCYYFCWLPNSLGEQNTNWNWPQYYWKWVHCSFNLNKIIDFIYESYEISWRFIWTTDKIYSTLLHCMVKYWNLYHCYKDLKCYSKDKAYCHKSIITFDVLLVTEQLYWTQLIPPNRWHIFPQIPLDKRASATCGIILWGDNLFLEIQSSFTITTVSGGVWEYQNGN